MSSSAPVLGHASQAPQAMTQAGLQAPLLHGGAMLLDRRH